MKPPQKSEPAKSVKALIDELSAVRAVVLDKQPAANPGERAMFEARLFESWVIDRLAQHECQMSMIGEELAGVQKELAALRKIVPPPTKKTQKDKKKGKKKG